MKRSNIILATSVGLSIAFIAAIPVLYHVELSKARSTGNQNYQKRIFDNAKAVKLVDAKLVTIIPSDSLIVHFKTNAADSIKLDQQGDTLLITGNARVIVTTGKRNVVAVRSNILVKADMRRMDPYSLSIDLRESRIYSLALSQDTKVTQYLNDFRISDNRTSVVDLSGRFDINHLYLSNVKEFNCTNEIGLRETDFSFDNKVKTMTCREGMNIVATKF